MSSVVKKCNFPICSSKVEHNHVCSKHDFITELPTEGIEKSHWFCVDCFSCNTIKNKECQYCHHLKDEIMGWARRRTINPCYLPLC